MQGIGVDAHVFAHICTVATRAHSIISKRWKSSEVLVVYFYTFSSFLSFILYFLMKLKLFAYV